MIVLNDYKTWTSSSNRQEIIEFYDDKNPKWKITECINDKAMKMMKIMKMRIFSFNVLNLSFPRYTLLCSVQMDCRIQSDSTL